MFDSFTPVLQRVWDAVRDGIALDDCEPAPIRMSGPRTVLPCTFDVTGLATAAVASAHLAASRVLAAHQASADVASVSLDSRAACAAFATERLFTPIGWERPAAWDEIAGNYRCADGWIKLHTNYAYHRRAVEEVLDAHDRRAVAARVADWGAQALETAVVGAGGAAAALHSNSTWLASSAGAATRDAPVASTRWVNSGERPGPAGAVRLPFDGLKVLDLTRVIAGPVCTGFLASMGADVLRIDPPGFAEVAPLVPVTTAGKRTAALDLGVTQDRRIFERLVSEADALVCGLRADALERLGYDETSLRALNSHLVLANLNAYGWTGPWRARRGFDSLVQMSCGIGVSCTEGDDAPGALPVQALDHATGWLLASAIGRVLQRQILDGRTATIHASLIGTARLLQSLPKAKGAVAAEQFPPLVETETAWGPAQTVGPAGHITGVSPVSRHRAGPLGRDEPRFL